MKDRKNEPDVNQRLIDRAVTDTAAFAVEILMLFMAAAGIVLMVNAMWPINPVMSAGFGLMAGAGWLGALVLFIDR